MTGPNGSDQTKRLTDEDLDDLLDRIGSLKRRFDAVGERFKRASERLRECTGQRVRGALARRAGQPEGFGEG